MKNTFFYNKLLNFLIKKGKKNNAKSILNAFAIKIRKVYRGPLSALFTELFSKLSTSVETKRIKMRRNKFVVPFLIKPNRRTYLAIKWFVISAKKNTRKIPMEDKLIGEIVSTLKKNAKSYSIELKKQNESQAVFNKSNLHFRW